ncbi:MAG: tetratricopeptide repeat protein [Kangiellaceae bacterium]|jgi:tetratricopeptide (TPR) repeat protein|nr:tetratricopeptide repeat protein [Kangiellaceae bacterium]
MTLHLKYLLCVVCLFTAFDSFATEKDIQNLLDRAYSDFTKGNLSKAIKVAITAKELAITSNKLEKLGEALRVMAHVYRRLDDYDEALAKYQQALAIFESIADHGKTIATMDNIATIYSNMDNYQTALEWQGKAIELLGESNSEQRLQLLLNKAYLHYEAGEFDNSDSIYKQASELVDNDNDPITAFYYYIQRGEISRVRDKVQLSIEQLNTALSIANQQGNDDWRRITELELAKSYLSINDTTEALNIMHGKEPLFLNSDRPKKISEFYQVMSNVYEINGDYKVALSYFKKGLSYGKKQLDIKIRQQANVLNIERQVDESHMQISKIEREYLKVKSELNYQILIYQIISSILLIALIIVLIRNTRSDKPTPISVDDAL